MTNDIRKESHPPGEAGGSWKGERRWDKEEGRKEPPAVAGGAKPPVDRRRPGEPIAVASGRRSRVEGCDGRGGSARRRRGAGRWPDAV